MGYDGSVNLTQIGGDSFTFDAENRLISETGRGSSASYVYDGGGRRVMKTVDTTTTFYVYDPAGQVAAEYSSTPPEVYGTEYLSADCLGNVRLISGAATACHDYLPFGEEIPATWGRAGVACLGASDGVTRRFTGKERDAETGLDYFGARYLASAQGRFTGPDAQLNDQSALTRGAGTFIAMGVTIRYVSTIPIHVKKPKHLKCGSAFHWCQPMIWQQD